MIMQKQRFKTLFTEASFSTIWLTNNTEYNGYYQVHIKPGAGIPKAVSCPQPHDGNFFNSMSPCTSLGKFTWAERKDSLHRYMFDQWQIRCD